MNHNDLSKVDREFAERLEAIADAIAKADVILGVHQKGRAILYGVEKLETIVKSAKAEAVNDPLIIEYDSHYHSWQLEILVATITTIKGRCDYQASEGARDGQHRFEGWRRQSDSAGDK